MIIKTVECSIGDDREKRLKAICYIFKYFVHRHTENCLEIYPAGYETGESIELLPFALARHFLEASGIINLPLLIETSKNNDDIYHGHWESFNTEI